MKYKQKLEIINGFYSGKKLILEKKSIYCEEHYWCTIKLGFCNNQHITLSKEEIRHMTEKTK